MSSILKKHPSRLSTYRGSFDVHFSISTDRESSPLTKWSGDVSPLVTKETIRDGGNDLVNTPDPQLSLRHSLGTPSLLTSAIAKSSLKKTNSRPTSPAFSTPSSRASSPTLSHVGRPDSPIFYKNDQQEPPLADFSGYVVEKDPMVKVKINGIEYGRRPSLVEARSNG